MTAIASLSDVHTAKYYKCFKILSLTCHELCKLQIKMHIKKKNQLSEYVMASWNIKPKSCILYIDYELLSIMHINFEYLKQCKYLKYTSKPYHTNHDVSEIFWVSL